MRRLAFRFGFGLLLWVPLVAHPLPDAFDNPCPKLLLRKVVACNGVTELYPDGFSRKRTILE